MKCPSCEGNMVLGFIYGDRYALKWVPEKEDKGAILQWFSKGIKLSSPFSNNKVESYLCEKCNKIMIDLEKNNY